MNGQPIYPAKSRGKRLGPLPLLRLVILVLLPLCLAMSGQARAGQTLRYLSEPGQSLVGLSGTSTLHDWSAQGKVIHGSVEFLQNLHAKIGAKDQAFPLVTAEHITLDFRIPVKSLKSDTDGMDDEIYKTLDSAEHPNIAFSFLSAAFVSQPTNNQYVFKVKGDLRINGVSRPQDLAVMVTHLSGDELLVNTKTTVKMTDFKITPPSLMCGLLKSGDKVKIKLAWCLVLDKERSLSKAD